MRGSFCVRDRVWVEAPVGRCFALSTSLRVVERELGMHPVAAEYARPNGERVATRTTGLVGDGDVVRWEGWQLGLPQVHVSLIASFVQGQFFQDRMIEGRFQWFEHDHGFRGEAGGTWLEDEIRFRMRWGWAGWVIGRLVLLQHVRKLLGRRFRLIKGLAEGDGWREYLGGGGRD